MGKCNRNQEEQDLKEKDMPRDNMDWAGRSQAICACKEGLKLDWEEISKNFDRSSFSEVQEMDSGLPEISRRDRESLVSLVTVSVFTMI